MAYGTDLAHIHDTGFGHVARDAAPGLLGILRERGITGGRIVDLGCGSGIMAAEFLDAGLTVTGIDISPAMIRLAKHRAPGGDFVVGSVLDTPLPRAQAVTAVGEILNYRFDERQSTRTLGRLFGRIYESLEKDGLFLFDVAEPSRGRGDTERFFDTGDWTCLVRYERDEARARLTRHIVTYRKHGKTYRRAEEEHRLQLYPRGEILRLLRAAGFRAKTIPPYGGMAFPKGYCAFMAWKARGRG